jgi:hypothetical protein
MILLPTLDLLMYAFLDSEHCNVSKSSMFETVVNIERCAMCNKEPPQNDFTDSSESQYPRGILNSLEVRRATIATGHSKERTNARHRGAELRYCLLWYYTTPETTTSSQPTSAEPHNHLIITYPIIPYRR